MDFLQAGSFVQNACFHSYAAACIYVIFIYPSALPLYAVVRARTDGYGVHGPGITGILFCCHCVEIPVLPKNYNQTFWRHRHSPTQGRA